VIGALCRAGLDLETDNVCGLELPKSLARLAACRECWAIDSALLHYARLFGLRSVSFWGPTAPRTLLKPAPIDEEVHYAEVACSPCVHAAESPPCAGHNLCMTALVRALDPEEEAELPPVVAGEPA
jgi:ADP-heptose:LPS heptosyltransferase